MPLATATRPPLRTSRKLIWSPREPLPSQVPRRGGRGGSARDEGRRQEYERDQAELTHQVQPTPAGARPVLRTARPPHETVRASSGYSY